MNAWDIKRTVLELVVDDSFALSEVVSRIHQENSHLSVQEARRVARDTVAEMFDLGLIEVLHLSNPRAAEVTLDPSAAAFALEDDLAWLPSTHWRPHLRIAATASGKEAYYGAK
jgi:hypothetical protein